MHPSKLIKNELYLIKTENWPDVITYYTGITLQTISDHKLQKQFIFIKNDNTITYYLNERDLTKVNNYIKYKLDFLLDV